MFKPINREETVSNNLGVRDFFDWAKKVTDGFFRAFQSPSLGLLPRILTAETKACQFHDCYFVVSISFFQVFGSFPSDINRRQSTHKLPDEKKTKFWSKKVVDGYI